MTIRHVKNTTNVRQHLTSGGYIDALSVGDINDSYPDEARRLAAGTFQLVESTFTEGASGGGSVWHPGAGVPSDSLGVDGDFYFDSSTGDVYVKAAGHYDFVSSIEGPPGDPGADGPTGGPGQDGTDGLPGDDGVDGKAWSGILGLRPRDCGAGASAGTVTQNMAYGWRERLPATGALRDLSIVVGTVSNGNVDVGVYTRNGTTRDRVWSSGSVACPAVSAGAIIGDPVLACTGQIVDFVFVSDSATAQFLRIGLFAAGMTLPFTTLGDLSTIDVWSKASVGIPLPAQITGVAGSNQVPSIFGRWS